MFLFIGILLWIFIIILRLTCFSTKTTYKVGKKLLGKDDKEENEIEKATKGVIKTSGKVTYRVIIFILSVLRDFCFFLGSILTWLDTVVFLVLVIATAGYITIYSTDVTTENNTSNIVNVGTEEETSGSNRGQIGVSGMPVNTNVEDGYEYSNDDIQMPRFSQGDARWRANTYGTSTIGYGGCGPSCISIVVSTLLCETITPDKVVEKLETVRPEDGMWYWVNGAGSSHEIFGEMATAYNLSCDSMGTTEDDIRDSLESGKFVICGLQTGNVYTASGGHFVVIRKYSDGMYYINDPGGFFDKDTGYSWSDIVPVTSVRNFY